MSLENITTKIKHDAETRAEEIRAEAAKRKATLEAETVTAQKTLQQEASRALDKKKQQRKAVRLSSAKQDQHIAMQEAKRTALNKVLEDAYQQFVNAPAEQYVAFVRKYAETQNLQPDSIQSVVAPTTRKVETEQILTSLGVSAAIEYSDQLTAGLIFQGDEYAIDLSFDRLYHDATPALEGVAKQILFSAT